MSTLPETSHPAKLSVNQWLFLSGLVTYTLGQILINLGPDFVNNQRPIDYAHWLLILGVLQLVPYAGNLPRSILNLIAAPVLILGIGAVIGMCVIDFIFWSLPPGDLEQQVAGHLIDAPAIWQPFMRIGPNPVFMTGLLLPGLAFFRTSRIGTGLVVIGCAVVYFFPLISNPPGYMMLTAGYWLCFRRGHT